nr:YetF domain-containing protein [Paracoccus saliphilus]
MTEPMLFDSWAGLFRVLVVGVAAYAALIFMLRASGKRTLSKMNAFDLIVTVALGSTLATVLLSATVPLAEGLLGLALLVYLQYAITWLSVRSARFRDLIKGEPSLLVHDGQYLDGAMRRQRVTREEVGAALRESGRQDLSGVASVVLETDGSMTVIGR